MSQSKSILKILVLLGFFFSLYFVVGAIFESLEASETTIQLPLEDQVTEEISIDEDTKFTLWLSDIVFNEDSFICYVDHDGTYSNFSCNDFWSDGIVFEIEVYDSFGNYYLFEDMGNVSLTSNDSKAIGTIELPQGDYTVTITNPTNEDYSNLVKMQDSRIFTNIFKIVFGSIIGVFLLIANVILLTMSRTKQKSEMYHSDEYYLNQRYHQDHNDEIFNDEDDPFAKYD